MKLIESALATFRISRLFTREDGPWYIFQKMRVFSGKYAAKNNKFSAVAELIECPYCLGIWIVPIVYLMPDKIRKIFAIAGIQVLLQDMADMMNAIEER